MTVKSSKKGGKNVEDVSGSNLPRSRVLNPRGPGFEFGISHKDPDALQGVV